MHLIGNNTTQELDSLRCNTFWSPRKEQGYNQVKDKIYGKFEGKLHEVDIIKNAEVLYFMK
jgi:hypothetical protein